MTTRRDRQGWLQLLAELYEETGHPRGELKICTECAEAPCEVGPEQVTLLPYEDEFIQARLAAEGRCVSLAEVRGIAGCEQCPFFVSRRCSIHPHRPIDCRTYPLVPRFALGEQRIAFSVSGVCPIRAGVDRPFIELMRVVWEKLHVRLSEDWKKTYAARQPSARLEDLVNPR
jgi:Fe-S-cluster containining protein